MTLMSQDVWKEVTCGGILEPWFGSPLVGAVGTPLDALGTARVSLLINFSSACSKSFQVGVVVVSGLTADVILGLDFLLANDCTIDAGQSKLNFPHENLSVTLGARGGRQMSSSEIPVSLGVSVSVPAYSEMEVMAKVPSELSRGTWIFEGMDYRKQKTIATARALVSPHIGQVPVRLCNPGGKAVMLQKDTRIGTLELVEDSEAKTHITSVTQGDTVQQQAPKEKRDLIWTTINDTCQNLSCQEREELCSLLVEYHDVISSTSNEMGRTSTIQHHINTGDHPPIRQQLRRLAPHRREQVRELLQDMLGRDVIQPSKSPWASPIVLVQKKDGSIRFCVDYRKVNSITRKDAYPLPRIDDTLDTLAGSQWFSTLDLVSGYWQVTVDEVDRKKTAFCTPEGLFQFKVMPFGLCNAPATFQRLMDMVLAGLQWSRCLVYLDDIIVPGKTFAEHLQNLEAVFQRFRQAGLKLKLGKCSFCQTEVAFLGHIVSRDGVATDPEKTAKVAKWPEPTSCREVQQFLGFANYYRRFVKDYAQIARPLHRLTEQGRDFQWSEECQIAFDTLRRALTSSPILAFPNPEKPFILDTDASDTGIGAVLSQEVQDGREHVIAYASRVLSKPERRYCVTRKELLAVVFFCHHFRPYLLGRHFTLRTDHGSLTWLWNFKDPEGQLARWLERLQEYDFSIVHRPGKKHGNADGLSRLPCRQCGRESHTTVSTVRTQDLEDKDLLQKQLEDSTVGPVLRAMREGRKSSDQHIRSKSRLCQQLFAKWDQLVIQRSLLWRRFEQANGSGYHLQLLVPITLQKDVLRDLHEGVMGGHLGIDKTLARIQERYYWPGYSQDVKDWCKSCSACATRKSPAPKNKAPLKNIKVGYPMQLVAVDILGPLPESITGNSYILVAGDYFTRWMEAYPIPNQEASTVAKKLTEEMFLRFSPPDQLHSDQGRQFESNLIAEVCKLLGICKTRTTPYHPQGDGLVERFNRTLVDMLAVTAKDNPFDWENHVRAVCMAYNTSVQTTTGYSPFYLMFGRQAKMPIDITLGISDPESASWTPATYASALRTNLTSAYENVRNKMGSQLDRQKELYDEKTHGEPFHVGQLVWLHSNVVKRGSVKKFHHPWTGPFKIVSRLSDVTYRIQDISRPSHRLIVHFNRLKKCLSRTPSGPPSQPPSQDVTTTDTTQPLARTFGETLEVVDDSEPLPRRYPVRQRTQPERFGPFVTH